MEIPLKLPIAVYLPSYVRGIQLNFACFQIFLGHISSISVGIFVHNFFFLPVKFCTDISSPRDLLFYNFLFPTFNLLFPSLNFILYLELRVS
jgi:hypothetical protein